jgi:hypothetical protein
MRHTVAMLVFFALINLGGCVQNLNCPAGQKKQCDFILGFERNCKCVGSPDVSEIVTLNADVFCARGPIGYAYFFNRPSQYDYVSGAAVRVFARNSAGDVARLCSDGTPKANGDLVIQGWDTLLDSPKAFVAQGRIER